MVKVGSLKLAKHQGVAHTNTRGLWHFLLSLPECAQTGVHSTVPALLSDKCKGPLDAWLSSSKRIQALPCSGLWNATPFTLHYNSH